MDEPATSTCPRPVLISIGGLPATGKTTVSRLVASHRRAAYVRVDTLEAAVAASEGVHETTNGWESPPGYLAGRAVAADQLQVGLDVVVESVNATEAARDGWRAVAQASGARFLEVEIVCSDPAEHRRRATQREIDIAGITAPTWDEISAREYDPWSRGRLVIDTSTVDPDTAAEAVEAAMAELVRPDHEG